MIDVGGASLLISIPCWLVIGTAIGRVTHEILIRRPHVGPRPDIVIATVLSIMGSIIGGAVGWSMSGSLNPVFVSIVGATLGALVLCVLFQFVVPL